jgi:hypothetical protein
VSVNLIAPLLLGLFFGVGVGCVPFVQEHLDWRMAGVIPVGGFLIGMAAGFLMFHLARLLNASVEGKAALVLALAAGVGFVGTDVGKYFTMPIEVDGDDGKKTTIHIKDVLSFSKYMEIRLAKSNIPGRHGRKGMEVGHTMALLFYTGDCLGAGVGAWILLASLAGAYPYCRRCSQYKKGAKKASMSVPDDEAQAQPMLEKYTEALKAGYVPLAAFLKETAAASPAGATARRIEFSEHCCASCGTGTLMGELKAKDDKGNYQTVSGTAVNIESAQGNGFSL